jgi:hypothetical protein
MELRGCSEAHAMVVRGAMMHNLMRRAIASAVVRSRVRDALDCEFLRAPLARPKK